MKVLEYFNGEEWYLHVLQFALSLGSLADGTGSELEWKANLSRSDTLECILF